MILEVLKYPNPRLREVSKPVQVFDAALAQLAEDMIETMWAEKGIGLAAPQVGELKRMLVIDTRPKDEKGRYKLNEMTELERAVEQPLVIINPEIVAYKGKTTFDEGCLSVPSFFETVERHEWIRLKFNNLMGEEKFLELDGLLAIVVQHEMDHLEGTLFIDHISFVKSQRIKKIIQKEGYPKKELVRASQARSVSEKET
jgi:peptide deformylase